MPPDLSQDPTGVLARLRGLLGGRTAPVAATAAELEAVALLISGTREARDRSFAIRVLKRVAAGDVAALSELRPHTVSMLRARAGDNDLMARIEAVLAETAEPRALSALASLRAQMRQWDGALTLLDRVETAGASTAMDRFMSFQAARIGGRRQRLEQFDLRSLAPFIDAFPEVAADVAARHLTLGRPARFAREIEGLRGREAEGDALAAVARALAKRPAGPGASVTREDRQDWGRILAVCSLRCSGGSAIQDFIEDHPGVRTSAGEYVALTGYMGLNWARQDPSPRVRGMEFVRQHLLGLTVPLSRSSSRILRQARADRAAGQIPATLVAVDDALTREDTIHGFLDRLLLNIWASYLDAAPGALLLKKLFSQGQLDMFARLPPLRCVMVWRDPRDQYADQVNRGFCRKGDVEGFIAGFEKRVGALRRGLATAGPEHRALFVNVGFEAFVGSAAYREDLRRTLGLHAEGYVAKRFLPEVSQANVGIWRDQCDAADIAVIEARLRPWLDTTAIRLDNGDR